MKRIQKIHSINRVLLVIAAVLLIVAIRLPLWRIDLTAPQYPEGLRLLIYPSHLGGDVQIVSGLNHYIGMRALRTEDFYEFKILPGILIGFSILLVLTALLNRKWILQWLFILFFLFGIVSMFDFWKWEYNYGHNLNPEAPIVVPGMAYQPPLIGFKQLLNFGAYSIPDIGGWIFAGIGLGLLIMNVAEYLNSKKLNALARNSLSPMVLLSLWLFSSCTVSTSPIVVGKDKCDYCKMTVSDDRFGGELLTNKGKVYKFDDAHCLLSYLHSAEFKKESLASVYFVDFSDNHPLIPATTALFLKSDLLKSPMNGNIAAFSHADSLQLTSQKFSGSVLHWNELNRP